LAIVNISYCVQQHRGHKLLRSLDKKSHASSGKEGGTGKKGSEATTGGSDPDLFDTAGTLTGGTTGSGPKADETTTGGTGKGKEPKADETATGGETTEEEEKPCGEDEIMVGWDETTDEPICETCPTG